MKNFYFSVMILYKIRQLLVSPIISTYNKFKINVMPKFFLHDRHRIKANIKISSTQISL